MIVPSIDLMDGQAVQLVGGEKKAIDAGDPLPIAERFAVAGELAVIDLDAALGRGHNRDLVERLVRRFPCRVGGGIRDLDTARRWLDAGARKVILGTAATPELLRRLPKERVLAALDARHGKVAVEGWTQTTTATIEQKMQELAPFCRGFLVTAIEREGRMGGVDLDTVRRLRGRAGEHELTFAGGVTTAAEVAALDHMCVDAQVGMALYTGRLDLGEAVAAPLRDEQAGAQGLWPTVVVDETERALGLCWSSRESVALAVSERRGIYQSRSRGLWRKGETSGNVQELLRVELDCDRDALRFVVRQQGSGFCHQGTWTCFGDALGLPALLRTLCARREEAPAGSYTARLLNDPELLRSKLMEEAGELAAARSRDEVAWEAADVLYFTAVAMVRAGVELAEVERELTRRSLQVTRRNTDEEAIS